MLKIKYTLLSIITFVSLICISCAPTAVVTEEGTSTVSSDNESYITVFTHDKDCRLTDSIVGVEGETAIGLFALQGPHATSAYYTLGYQAVSGSSVATFATQRLSNVATASGSSTNRIQAKITLSSPSSGTHHYRIIIRNYNECYEKTGKESKCKISGKVDAVRSYDTATDIYFKIAEDTTMRDVMMATVVPGLFKGLGALTGDSTLQSLVTTVGDTIGKLAITETAPNEAPVVENGCVNGWPTK